MKTRVGLAGVVACALSWHPAYAQLDAHAYTADDRIRVDRGSWLAPERVARIEVGGGSDGLEAWIDKRAWPLIKDPHKPVHVLVVDEAVRSAWRGGATLTIGYPTQRTSGGELTLRASLRRLELPAGGTELTLKQRSRAELPGTEGFLVVRIDDITDGQTMLAVTGGDRSVLVERRSLRQGDHATIDLGDGRYALVVERLRNLLIGDDYAILRLLPAEQFETNRIEALLRRVAAADVTFVREGKDYTAAEAAEHLRRKLAAAGREVATLDDFITRIGSRSSLTGSPYTIKLADGTATTAEAWLREQATALARGAAKPGAGGTEAGGRRRP